MTGVAGVATGRILFAVQNFRQGWGGAPESVRLMARVLSRLGIASDIYDGGRLTADVGELSKLPDVEHLGGSFDLTTTGDYIAILQAGPWQSPVGLRRLLRARGQARWIYLPRGGLGRVEFSRPRDLKKYPYLAVVERPFVTASDAVVFSSETERRHTLSWSFSGSRAVVIPDFVSPPRSRPAPERLLRSIVTFAFLAEISPRKGLHFLVDAFVAWVRSRGLEDRVRLMVGGAPRPGSESYLAMIRARHAAVVPDGVQIDFLGAVAHGDREAFYTATDVMVVASSFESFGLTVFEAMGEGCVVLSTPHVGALEQTRGLAGVIALPTATVDALFRGLDEAFSSLDQASRSERVAAASQAIERSNALALEHWSGILGLEGPCASDLDTVDEAAR